MAGALRATRTGISNSFMPLQAIYRWVLRRELARADPTNAVELPLDRGRRDRFVPRGEIERDLPRYQPTTAHYGPRRSTPGFDTATTYDRYGHLMPGAERESADRLSAYLDTPSGALAPLANSI